MRTIFITGASSGLGLSLALEYAKSKENLILLGRDKDRLELIADKCRKLGATVETEIADVRDRQKMKDLIEEYNEKSLIDIVYANAGVSENVIMNTCEDNNRFYNIFDVNIYGVLNTILPAICCMKERGAGQIVLISSMAGFRGMSSAPAYSSSKNCIRALGEALRGSLSKYNIKVSTVCPGFIKTPLTDVNKFYMPFLMSSEKASEIIIKKVEKNKGLIAFPFIMYFAIKCLTFLPFCISDFIFRILPKK